MTIRVQPVGDELTVQWDGCVRAEDGWTHFHLYGWRHVIERVFGHECLYFAALDDLGTIQGVLPLVRLRSRVFGHYLVSMPFVNYGGPLGSAEAVRALGDHARELARTSSAELLQLRSRRALELDLDASHHKITVVLDLPQGGIAPLWDSLKPKVRSQVRRPSKEGVRVVFGREQLDPFYGVFARHMHVLGTPVQSRRLFEVIAETFLDDVWFGCAYLGDQPIAAGCGFAWAREFEMTWASALREFNTIAPNMLLYWSFIERCIDRGLKTFNFGRCTPGGGTHRFKRQWGSRDEELWWYQWRSGRRASTPSPDAAAFSWGPRIWRRLPLAIANRLGPRVVRSIP